MRFRLSLSLFVLCMSVCTSVSSIAQQNQATIFSESDEAFPKVISLNITNERFLNKQRDRVDTLLRQKFGQQLKKGKQSIPQLQRVIDEELLSKTDTPQMQALGVALGDAFVESHKNFNWRVYHDDLGKSHAVCIDNTKHCLFPITMLSRRMEVGIKPDVTRVFNSARDTIKQHLPKSAFDN